MSSTVLIDAVPVGSACSDGLSDGEARCRGAQSADHERFVQALCRIELVVGEVRSLARSSGSCTGEVCAEVRSMVEAFVGQTLRKCVGSCKACAPTYRLCGLPSAAEQWSDRRSRQPAQVSRQMYGRANIELLRAAGRLKPTENDRPVSILLDDGETVRHRRRVSSCGWYEGWRARPFVNKKNGGGGRWRRFQSFHATA
ncbi:hypothetical protein ACU4GD_14655 [Cupriavidus basilensis]